MSHAYGPATDTPGMIRALVSNNKAVRDYGRVLVGSIVHQGTVYPATLTALPFLIELLGVPEVPDEHALLSLIQWCSGYDPEFDAETEDKLSPYQRDQLNLYRAL